MEWERGFQNIRIIDRSLGPGEAVKDKDDMLTPYNMGKSKDKEDERNY